MEKAEAALEESKQNSQAAIAKRIQDSMEAHYKEKLDEITKKTNRPQKSSK